MSNYLRNMSNNKIKSLILNRLKQHYGFNSDTDFANFLGIKPQTLSSWHSRDTFDTELLYAKCINLDANFLLTGEGEIEKQNIKEEGYNQTITSLNVTRHEKSVILPESQMPKVVTVDKSGNDNVVLVASKATAGYLQGYGDPEFIERLPTFSLPNINNGTFRMFQVSGHSMYPTISDGSYVVGEWVENWVKDVKDNRIYVVVSDEGVLVKRVLNRLKKYNSLFLKSDNRKDFPNLTLQPTQVKEVWAVKIHLNFELPDPALLYDRLNDLESEMEHLKSILKTKQ